jgi:FKBP-type peptidyl-prolyl cis-trans isomerase
MQLDNFTPTDTVDKLTVLDIKEGTGEAVQPGATITAHYTGALAATGVVFQSSKDFGRPIQFGLGQVIKGWTDGVPGMKAGGIRRLLIPAEQAYGSTPPHGSGIPANAPLVFDIELVSID